MDRTSERRLFSGSTVQKAILAAARELGVNAEKLAYVVRPGRQGVVRGRTRVVIEVDPAAPQRRETVPEPKASASPAPKPKVSLQAGRPERPSQRSEPIAVPAATYSPVDPVAGQEAIESALSSLLLLAGEEDLVSAVKISHGNDEFRLRWEGRDEGSTGAQVLEAIGVLLPRAVRGLVGSPVAIRVDTDGVRERRLEELKRKAAEAATQARRTGEPVLLEEMDAGDRRIIHLTLAEDTTVQTESLGLGPLKRVRVAVRT